MLNNNEIEGASIDMINGDLLWNNEITKDMIHINIGKQLLHSYDLERNMYDVLKRTASEYSNKIFLIDNEGKEYSYEDILSKVDRFASYLYDVKGVRKGNEVGILLYNSVEFIVSFFSITKLGAISVPLPTKYRPEEINQLIEKTNMFLLIMDNDFIEGIIFHGEIIVPILSNANYGFHSYTGNSKSSMDISSLLEDRAMILFTSGTTSMSKGVVLKNYNIMHAVEAYRRTLGVTSMDRTIICVPIYHITGLVAILSLFTKVGGTIYIHRYFEPIRVLDTINDSQLTFIHSSPTVYIKLLEQSGYIESMDSIRMLACGSSNMPVEVIQRLKKWMPNMEFRTIYGLTETTSPGTIFPVDATTSKYIGSSGIPIPGMKLRIVNEEGYDLKHNELGEILVSGTNVLDEYSTTNELLKDGWLSTGDIGYYNDEGYVYIVDRKKDMINCGGEKVFSFDVENVIYQYEGVIETAVVGIPCDTYGEQVAAVIKVDNRVRLDKEILFIYLKKHLASYKVPKRIHIVDEIPKTKNGKIDKKAIRLLFMNGGLI